MFQFMSKPIYLSISAYNPKLVRCNGFIHFSTRTQCSTNLSEPQEVLLNTGSSNPIHHMTQTIINQKDPSVTKSSRKLAVSDQPLTRQITT